MYSESAQDSITTRSPIVTMTDRTDEAHEEEPGQTRYELEDDVGAEAERVSDYTAGGYHPVAIGDLLGDGGRFRVLHKLGHGGFATVWLCRDNASNKWRAVKIMAAQVSTPDCADFKALKLFGGIDADTLATNHVQLPLEHFWIDGPNGRHVCFVLPFLGPSLSNVYNLYGHVPELMKDICFQLVKAMRFIHSHNLCHGDFRPDNILFRLTEGVDEMDEEELMEVLGKPIIARVIPVEGTETEHIAPGVPAYLVRRAMVSYGSGLCSAQIAVIDFGVSYRVSQPPLGKGTGIPIAYAAPEDIFERDEALGFHTDIWALGCTITKVRLGFMPFAGEADDVLSAVKKMESIMGPMPYPYRSVWKNWDGEFVNCQRKGEQDDQAVSWEDETVCATLDNQMQEQIRRSRIEEVGVWNHLEYRLHRGLAMIIDKDEAEDIAAQAEANPLRLPSYKRLAEGEMFRHPFDKQIHFKLAEPEREQMRDLLFKIFHWQPEQRAKLEEILEHEWFGRRNQEHQPASPPKTTGKHSTRRRTRRSKRKAAAKSARNARQAQGAAAANDAAANSGNNGNGRGEKSILFLRRTLARLREAHGWMMMRLTWCLGTILGRVESALASGLAAIGWRSRVVDEGN
ncbi:hypothetical protein VTK56DRAFT_5538 [Thermocarpiscus australiensis]